MVREEIVSFIESEIVPRYDGFDPAHRRDHVMTVMSQAMELYSLAPEDVKKEMDQESARQKDHAHRSRYRRDPSRPLLYGRFFHLCSAHAFSPV